MKKFAKPLGYILVMLGLFSTVISTIGVNVVFLEWIDAFGEGWGFVFKLLIALIGFVIIAVYSIDVERENEEEAVR